MIVVKSHPQRYLFVFALAKNRTKSHSSLAANRLCIGHIDMPHPNQRKQLPPENLYVEAEGGGTNSSASGFLINRNQIAHLPPVPH